MKHTFQGLSWRVQLCAWDLPAIGNFPHALNFSVAKLPQEAHRSTSFTAGHQLYYGPSLAAALNVVRHWSEQKPQLPKRWHKYVAAIAAVEGNKL